MMACLLFAQSTWSHEVRDASHPCLSLQSSSYLKHQTPKHPIQQLQMPLRKLVFLVSATVSKCAAPSASGSSGLHGAMDKGCQGESLVTAPPAQQSTADPLSFHHRQRQS